MMREMTMMKSNGGKALVSPKLMKARNHFHHLQVEFEFDGLAD